MLVQMELLLIEFFALQGYYMTKSDSYWPTLWDNLLVPSLRAKQSQDYLDHVILLLCSIIKYIDLLTPWSGVLLEKLTGSQLVKRFLAFYGT